MTREEAKEFIAQSVKSDVYMAKVADAIKALEQEPCEDTISRKSIKQKLQEHHDFFVNAYGGFSNLPQNDKSRVDEITNCIAMVVNEPPVTPQEPRIDFEELKSKILSEVDGSTDDAWLAYGEVCNRISNSIDEYVQNIKAMPSVTPPLCADCNFKMDEVRRAYDKVVTEGHVLDKIRAEIECLETYYDNDYFSGNKDAMFKCSEVLDILDKHKAETEE